MYTLCYSEKRSASSTSILSSSVASLNITGDLLEHFGLADSCPMEIHINCLYGDHNVSHELILMPWYPIWHEIDEHRNIIMDDTSHVFLCGLLILTPIFHIYIIHTYMYKYKVQMWFVDKLFETGRVSYQQSNNARKRVWEFASFLQLVVETDTLFSKYSFLHVSLWNCKKKHLSPTMSPTSPVSLLRVI